MKRLYAVTFSNGSVDDLSRCITYMNRQEVQPDKWIIVCRHGDPSIDSMPVPAIEVPYVLIAPDSSRFSTMFSSLDGVIPSGASVVVMSCGVWYDRRFMGWAKDMLKHSKIVVGKNFSVFDTESLSYMETDDASLIGCDAPLFGFSDEARNPVFSYFSKHAGEYPFRDAYRDLKASHVEPPDVYLMPMIDKTPEKREVAEDDDDPGWHEDEDATWLYSVIGEDTFLYLKKSGKVYVFSNVEYPETAKLDVSDDDVLIFLNTASSIDYYDGHPNRYVYRRAAKPSYGQERLNAWNRYVYGAGDIGIPKSFMSKIESEYDWNYPIEDGSTKSPTTGYSVAKYMRDIYPLREVILVNFGYEVKKSTHRCPWHNWVFEAKELDTFKHVFTAKLAGADNPEIRKIEREKKAKKSEKELTSIFISAGCDQMTRHDYGEIYDKYLGLFRGKAVNVVALTQGEPHLISALVSALPDATVYGLCSGYDGDLSGANIVHASGYAREDWESIPDTVSLIIDDSSHKLSDIVKGIPIFREHLADDGIIMIEDVPSDAVADAIIRELPGASCHKTTPVSPYGDDRIVTYGRSDMSDVTQVDEGTDNVRTEFEKRVETVFIEEDSDRATGHDYVEVFATELSRLVDRSATIVEIGRSSGAGLRSLRKLLPAADVYGILTSKIVFDGGATVVVGDGYSPAVWSSLPDSVDLIIDDGSHELEDIKRGLETFLSRLKPGGTLMIEDIKSEKDVTAILSLVPGAICKRTRPVSHFGDDRIVVYTKKG